MCTKCIAQKLDWVINVNLILYYAWQYIRGLYVYYYHNLYVIFGYFFYILNIVKNVVIYQTLLEK